MQKLIAAFLLAIMACHAGPAHAASPEMLFLQSIAGQWSGPGEVVAGKYKGAKFNCTFDSISEIHEIGMTLEGNCRLGVFSQSIKAKFNRNANGYYGMFNDGAQAKGLDITSGRIKKDHMVFELRRERVKGAMTARLADGNSMDITLAIKVEELMVPIIGMKLTRTAPAAVRTLAKN